MAGTFRIIQCQISVCIVFIHYFPVWNNGSFKIIKDTYKKLIAHERTTNPRVALVNKDLLCFCISADPGVEKVCLVKDRLLDDR